MTAVDLPEEPPVGTELTAPRMDATYRRTDRGWYVIGPLGSVMFPDLPGATWWSVFRTLDAFGGIETVTTEYRIHYRTPNVGRPDRVHIEGDIPTPEAVRESIAAWSSLAPDVEFELLRVESRRVTCSVWRDEPLEEHTS